MNPRVFAIAAALCALGALMLSAPALANDEMRSGSTDHVFQAVPQGGDEVPPNSSTGLGVVSLLLSADASALYYTVELTGASSTVNAAHLHLGVAGQNGPIVVNLCGAGGAPACGLEGLIASGTITQSSLVGPLAGHPLSELLGAFYSDSAYANAHTAMFPGGELRGQVESVDAPANNHDHGRHHGRGDHHDDDEDD